MTNEPVPQPTTVNFDLGLLTTFPADFTFLLPRFKERAWEQAYLKYAFVTINGTAQVCIATPTENILEAFEVGTPLYSGHFR